MDLRDKTVVVTGGARGLGLAAAQLFLERGARVVIGARRSESLISAVEMLNSRDRVTTVASDVSTVGGCRAVAAAALDAFGTIDVLFTNAGIYGTAEVEQTSEELRDEIADSNMKGTFFCVQAALPALGERLVPLQLDASPVCATALHPPGCLAAQAKRTELLTAR